MEEAFCWGVTVTKGALRFRTDPVAAEQRPGQRAGGAERQRAVEPLPAGPAGRAARHRHQEGKWDRAELVLCPCTSL